MNTHFKSVLLLFPQPNFDKLTRVLSAICIGCILCGVTPSQAGIIHRWSFDEANGTNLLDTIGTANGKILVIGTNTDYSRLSVMVRLAGGTRAQADYIEFPSGLVHSLTNVTIELWATPQAGQIWSRIFDFGPGNNTQAGTFFLSFCRGSTSLSQQRFEFGAPAAWTVDTAVATTAGTQYYYVVNWSATGGPNGGGLAQWYRNGVLQGSTDTGAMTIANVNDTVLWLGRSQYTADATATADYNELRIYNHAMSPAEINLSMANGPDNLVIPPPVAVNDAMTLNPGGMALISVLQSDQGLENGPNSITVVGNPTSGTAQVKTGGKILYTHNGGPATSDQFTYRIQNAFGSNSGIATVFITVSNSLRLPNTTITIPINPPPTAYQVVDAFPGLTFTQPLAMRTPAGAAYSNLLFVVERRGLITYIDVSATNPVKQTFLNISNQVAFDPSPTDGELGMLSMDFHPGFATNGIFFISYIAPGGSPYLDRVSRFTANPVSLTVNTNTQQVLYSMVDREFNHNAAISISDSMVTSTSPPETKAANITST